MPTVLLVLLAPGNILTTFWGSWPFWFQIDCTFGNVACFAAAFFDPNPPFFLINTLKISKIYASLLIANTPAIAPPPEDAGFVNTLSLCEQTFTVLEKRSKMQQTIFVSQFCWSVNYQDWTLCSILIQLTNKKRWNHLQLSLQHRLGSPVRLPNLFFCSSTLLTRRIIAILHCKVQWCDTHERACRGRTSKPRLAICSSVITMFCTCL